MPLARPRTHPEDRGFVHESFARRVMSEMAMVTALRVRLSTTACPAWCLTRPTSTGCGRAIFCPRVGDRSHSWLPHRQVVEGMVWRVHTGAPWSDVPERFGSWNTWYGAPGVRTQSATGSATCAKNAVASLAVRGGW
jgi:hypothetical protein